MIGGMVSSTSSPCLVIRRFKRPSVKGLAALKPAPFGPPGPRLEQLR